MLLLGKARAVEVIEGSPGSCGASCNRAFMCCRGFVDRLADAIVSLEYYMETVQAGARTPGTLLDNAQACVQALEQQPTPSSPRSRARSRRLWRAPCRFRALRTRRAATGRGGGGASAPTLAPSSSARAAAPSSMPTRADELFIEERTRSSPGSSTVSRWDYNPLERDSLVTVRRSFHTLKGAGAWSRTRVERVRVGDRKPDQRVLDNTLSRSRPSSRPCARRSAPCPS